ncbi:MAG: hypothetical protein MZU95_00860 [Desulfomicrobium escambiense]|nr:hypothetical protein [Desulfomicrobium escambiense]
MIKTEIQPLHRGLPLRAGRRAGQDREHLHGARDAAAAQGRARAPARPCWRTPSPKPWACR